MRFIHVPELEAAEAADLPSRFGKFYAPSGPVTLAPELSVSAPGLELVELEGELLALAPESVSWAFVDRHEAELLRSLQPARSVSWMRAQWPAGADAFVTTLFRRGLLALDGHLAIDRTIFHDSSNTPDGHLVELLLTEKCNLACGYCLAGANPKMPTMTEDIARGAVDLAFGMEEAPALTFEFSGGEPFLQFRRMRALVDYIRSHPRRHGRPVYFTVQTNCTVLDEERVQWLLDNEVSVGISLDGNPASHNVSRPLVNGRESFSRVLRGLDLLQGAGIQFGVLVVLNRSNVASAQALIDFLVENDIHSLKINPIAYLGTGRASWSDLGLEADEVLAYFQDFGRRVAAQRRLIREANLGSMCEFWVSKRRSDRCLRSHCGAGETFQAISASTTVV
ncbi:MAG: radical SAM protein, partial [Myxococcales bacterium]|nr:radical SAM protein [Myxococcales bacterium]